MTSSASSNLRSTVRADRLDTTPSRRTSRGAHDGLRAGLHIEERVGFLRNRLEARADPRSAAALRADVREARSHVRGWDKSNVSSATAARYDRVVHAMRADGSRPESAACKSSFEFKRAALVHSARASIKDGLRDLDRAKRAGDLKGAARAYTTVCAALDTLRRYPPSTGVRELDLQRKSAFTGPSRADPARTNGKRSSLANLPHDWRDRVQSEVREGDRAAVSVMALTGARPAELRGTKVRQDGDCVTLMIAGAKFDQDRGVKSRTLEFSRAELAETQAGRDLSDWLGNRPVRTVTYEGSLASLRERVSRAATRAGLDGVSCYSYRHQTARDEKYAGTDRETLARKMGHRSERSASVYG